MYICGRKGRRRSSTWPREVACEQELTGLKRSCSDQSWHAQLARTLLNPKRGLDWPKVVSIVAKKSFVEGFLG